MKVTADTNVLLRTIVADDKEQSEAALELLMLAEIVAVPLPTLCEFVWVLHRAYGASREHISEAIQRLLDTGNVVLNRAAVEAGLRVHDAGGDFADGVIAFEGQSLGAETFVSFDKQAVKLLEGQGVPAKLLGSTT